MTTVAHLAQEACSALAPQTISTDVLLEKYAKQGERSIQDVYARVARGLAQIEVPEQQAHYARAFYDNMMAGAIGAGRIMSAAGTDIRATLINCFVQPVGDCIQGLDDGAYPGIYEALKQAAETMWRGGGVGYDFSRIRPKGAAVRDTASLASGPCSYINVFDQSCATLQGAGSRRGAQMGVLRIDHPDVLEFISAKRTPGRWNNFNVSVGVGDAFMQAVHDDAPWALVHVAAPGAERLAAGAFQREDGLWVYRQLPAREIWDLVMRSACDFAEPGILFLDHINQDNNLAYCEDIAATNPCGEQPLPPYGCCDLGPIILTPFVRHPFGMDGQAPTFDFEAFGRVIGLQVRALDNVLDLTLWPLPEQKAEAQAKRRIGVGFTGLGDALVMLNLPYNSAAGRDMAASIACTLRDQAYRASIALAQERGPFPAFDAERYLSGKTFASRLPQSIREAMAQHGLRNSHLLSIAPTGTVSLAFADNASNGIEPAFSWYYTRKKRQADGSLRGYRVEDHAWRLYGALGGDVENLPPGFVTALEISAQDHIAMMQAVQPYIDTAISKTVNVAADYPFEDFKNLYMLAWQAQLKGLATYRPNAILGSVLEVTPVAVPPTASAVTPSVEWARNCSDLDRGMIDVRPIGELPVVAEKISYWTQDGQKTLDLTISFMAVDAVKDGKPFQLERAIEFSIPVGQNGESQQWITSSMRLLSLAARGGFLVRALHDMRNVVWDRGPVRLRVLQQEGGMQAPMWHDSEVAAVACAIEQILERRGRQFEAPKPAESSASKPMVPGKKCPECGAHTMIKKDGCECCTRCGHVGSCG
jgi:ribonucleoside-diphosphate reductase alpha chain